MKNLIDKYFEGQTTLEEEEKLNTYFNSGNVSEEHRQYAPLFQFFDRESSLETSDGFDERLFEKLEEKEPARVIPMRNNRPVLLKIAAAAAILLAAFFLLKPDNASNAAEQTAVDWSKYEITDEKLALEETEKALRLLSAKLNRGKAKTIEEVSKTETVAKYLN